MTNQSIKIANRAAEVAEQAVRLAETTGDRMQLANACGNLAKARLATKELGRAYEAAIRAGELHIELMGPASGTGQGMLAMAEKIKEKIDADYQKGVDWHRTLSCPVCEDRFPWSLQMDSAFEKGLDFLMTICHTCGAEFRIEKPQD